MPNKYKQVLIRVCYMIIIPIISTIHIALNTYRDNLHYIGTRLDDITPFIPSFSIPYLYWFVYVFIGLLYFALKDNKSYFRLLGSIVTGMSICFVIFFLYPTIVPRPDISGNTIFERLVIFIYSVDNPYNCFPSIHVLNAMIVTLFICRYSKGFGIKTWSIVSCISIILSTIFIKQHFVLDIAAGIVLSIVVYMFFTNEHFWSSVYVQKLIDLVIPNSTKDYPDTM